MNIKHFLILVLIYFSYVKSQVDLEYDLTHIEKFICTEPQIDCSGHGVCSADKEECQCFSGYQTFFVNYTDYITNKPRCNYQSKKQVYALFTALFLSFGSVYFYLGNYIMGYIQLTLFLGIVVFNTFAIGKLSLKHLKILNRNQVKNSFTLIIIVVMLSSVFIFWFIFDILMILFNVYKDSQNASLEPFI